MNQNQLAQISHVEEITGFSRSTLRRWWKKGIFPHPQKLNGTTLVWQTQQVKDWIDQQFQGDAHE